MALNNLGDIYNYCNDDLLDGELSDINEVINYLEEAQNIIAEVALIEAPLVTTVLDSTCKITMPTNLLKTKEFTLISCDGVLETPLEPLREWAGEAFFHYIYNGRTVNLYYYKKPTALNPNNLSQIPDVDARYYFNIAQYGAEMNKLKDDDTEAQDSFRRKFSEGLQMYSKNKGTTRQFKNVW